MSFHATRFLTKTATINRLRTVDDTGEHTTPSALTVACAVRSPKNLIRTIGTAQVKIETVYLVPPQTDVQPGDTIALAGAATTAFREVKKVDPGESHRGEPLLWSVET